ncbi:MAG: prenyltransferase [Candidatus Omnitrophota bacterium]
MKTTETIKAWALLSRLPFLSGGIVPFLLGSLIAFKFLPIFNLQIFLLALLAVILIMIITNFNGEIYDVAEDTLSRKLGKSQFGGGSQMIIENKIKSKHVKIVNFVFLIITITIGCVLQFYYQTGLWTLPLGITGIIFGFFYSKPPFRWVKRGIGEIMIGYSYGWLPVIVGFYIQTQTIIPILHWISLPISCTIFNVILINEFPDHFADKETGKNNLTVRLGKKKASWLYIFVSLSAIALFFISINKGAPKPSLILYVPVCVLSLIVSFMMYKSRYDEKNTLEKMCASTIIINLGTSLSYILGFLITEFQ